MALIRVTTFSTRWLQILLKCLLLFCQHLLFIQNIVTDRHNHYWNSENFGESLFLLRDTPLHRFATAPLFGRARAGGPRAVADDASTLATLRSAMGVVSGLLSDVCWRRARFSCGFSAFINDFDSFLDGLVRHTIFQRSPSSSPPPPAELLVSVAGKPDRNP